MTSAGKWVLGLLLLVVGAVFVARTISSEPDSQARVELPAAESAAAGKESEAAKAAAAAAKKAAAAPATDLACKKACVEVNEVANDAVTTAKLAPGSVTLSKLAFEVPNLNELVNEINARRAAEASAKAAIAEAAAATAQNDASISAAAANGLSVEAAARTAAIEKLSKEGAAADAAVLTKLNQELTDRSAADDVLQGKLNTEIADRAGAIANLRTELGNPNQVGAPIIQINNNEIVGDAVTSNKILDRTIVAQDLAIGAVTTVEILNRTILAEDLSSAAVVGRAAGETLTNTKERSLRGERTTNSASATLSAGDLALGTLTGEGDNVTTRSAAIGNVGIRTIGRNNLVNGAVDTTQLEASSVTSDKIAPNTITSDDVSILDATNLTSANIRTGSLFGALTPAGGTAAAGSGDLALGTISGQGDNDDAGGDSGAITGNLGLKTVGRQNLVDAAVFTTQLAESAVTSDKIALNTITADDVSILDSSNLTSANIRRGAVTGQGDNDDSTDPAADNTTVTGNLGLATVGRRNLVNSAVDATKLAAQSIDATKLTTGFLGDLVTEAEFTARLSTPVPSATEAGTPPLPRPNQASSPTDPGSIIDWSRLKNVPAGFADNVDEDGATGLTTYKNELKNTGTFNEGGASQPNDPSDPVSFNKVKDIDADILLKKAADVVCTGCVDLNDLAVGAVKGRALGGDEIVQNSIAGGTAGDIALGTITGQQAPAGSATITGNIALGTITAANLAPSAALDNLSPGSITAVQIGSGQVGNDELAQGAVTADKQRANASAGTGGASIGTVSGVAPAATTTLLITSAASENHRVLLNGQTTITCSGCVAGSAATVTYQLFDGTTAVGPEMTANLTNSRPEDHFSLSGIAISAGAPALPSPPGPALHTYTLRVTLTGLTGATPPTGVTLSSGGLSAVDLGLE